jgi:hypothetical protein
MRKEMPTHYSILTKNRPGALARLTKLLTEEGVTVSGMMIASAGDKASIQFLAPRGRALRGICCRSGMKVRETRIFERKAPNRPGELNHLVQAFHRKGINILSLSGISGAASNRMVLTRTSGDPTALA